MIPNTAQPIDGFVPFPADRADAYRAAGYWAGRPLDSVLTEAAARWPSKLAVVEASGEQGMTFAELDERAHRAAVGLRAVGIAPGDRVLLQLPNGSQFAVALFGLLRAGATPVMCLPGHRAAELSHFASVSEATGLLIADTANGFDYREMARKLVRAHPHLRHVIVDGDPQSFVSWTQLCESATRAEALPPADTESPALLLVSGGTTGLPKLIPRTHDDYVFNASASAELCGLRSDDIYLVLLSAGHNFPLACPGLLGAMTVGACTVFGTDPSPEAAFDTIARHGVTVTALVPALAKLWAQACDWEPVTPKTLRLLQVGGARLEPDDARRIRETLTPGLQQVFGMAEGLLNYTRLEDPADVVDNTVGRPLCVADELRIVDGAGEPVAPGEEGELLVRGPYTLNGYFRAERDNQRSFDPNGFYRSGDLVRRRQDGYLVVTGRVKDVITRAGETIAAGDLEEQMLSHPTIFSAAAVPLPDPYLGEKICAAVVFTGEPIGLAELNAYLDQRGVAAHSRPDMLVAMPALPTTPIGKIDKKAIVRQVGAA
ncbi:(2,3-dihydroxybenzoyl)adenylate synthase [Mycobacterium montefiorense]|uniref:2,3-dihydroxybenzoate-AMP ligase n=1 Tax=Mycobacterium montefiorense TaxID=154654 RepID=A0AA37PRL6_9MYCO|nr:AMP-binding protein [Mycobacterium montefiorense]GBG39885.1 2,3-dihydroxybenzoate-AMP ligase [Mycobacterium montefiorense]GKU36560.1 2,3-dihydroxybenzoate-AMP ligase [Mycobacterium montefiorense]GKU38663.1 2,3-dihydroxybenzoate-AMP ligase [Mycobacterium montefiorense]GKU46567.1 2,3-dihydroxybenzoate-AMP ligase [Mycobacterium montefiorense]GKU48834.1 2,3-dihydroxybenzoate-AMP ligase [Mycobacterium montefiorense]